jgi:predicted ferric reductase
MQVGVKSSGTPRFNLALGHMNDLFISLLVLMTARSSVWDFVLGISYEQSIVYHAWMGTIAFTTITLHLAIWWIWWLMKGDWVLNAITRTDDPNVNLVTKEACTFWNTMAATCGNGHFWVIPAIELWYFLLGLPAIGFLAFYPIRRAHYQAFYYGHHQFLIFFPLAYYHSWDLWKFATIGLVLFVFSRVVSRVRATRQVVVERAQSHPGGVTELQLRRKDGFPLSGQCPGQYVWLNVPDIDALEWHPFSISSAAAHAPLWTHHIRAVPPPAQGEWTQKLHRLASRADNFSVYYDGPYGVEAFKPPMGLDSLVFIAGGIGITNPLSYIFQALATADKPLRPRVRLIWVVRNRSMFVAFAPQLAQLMVSEADQDGIDVQLYETCNTPPEQEETYLLHGELSAPEQTSSLAALPIIKGRPDLPHLLAQNVGGEVAVFACGPPSLVSAAGEAAHGLSARQGHKGVYFHAEPYAL